MRTAEGTSSWAGLAHEEAQAPAILQGSPARDSRQVRRPPARLATRRERSRPPVALQAVTLSQSQTSRPMGASTGFGMPPWACAAACRRRRWLARAPPPALLPAPPDRGPPLGLYLPRMSASRAEVTTACASFRPAWWRGGGQSWSVGCRGPTCRQPRHDGCGAHILLMRRCCSPPPGPGAVLRPPVMSLQDSPPAAHPCARGGGSRWPRAALQCR